MIDKDLFSGLLLKLRQQHPFLSTLMMFADYRFSAMEDTFATDGKIISINKDYFDRLSLAQKRGVLLHTCLHCALLHTMRRGSREPLKWNIAADIVVNHIIEEIPNCQIPEGTAVFAQWGELSVEQAYEHLYAGEIPISLNQMLQDKSVAGESKTPAFIRDIQPAACHTNQFQAMQVYWKRALKSAQDSNKGKNHGYELGGLFREIEQIEEPQLDWRTCLWRFMSRTPSDFNDYDRRFIYRGLYMDHLQTESLRIIMAVDTSASVDTQELTLFMSETKAILSAYPHIQVMLYFVDTELNGPHLLNEYTELPAAKGDGGTDFTVFFEEVQRQEQFMADLCIYLTDGYSEFPEQAPQTPVLWVVSSGGAETETFPFGEVARLVH